MLNSGVADEDGVDETAPQTSWAGMGKGRARVSVQVSSSAVMAAAWTRMRYWVGEGVGSWVEVERVRVDGGLRWRACMFDFG